MTLALASRKLGVRQSLTAGSIRAISFKSLRELACLAKGIAKLGRPRLSTRLLEIRPEQASWIVAPGVKEGTPIPDVIKAYIAFP